MAGVEVPTTCHRGRMPGDQVNHQGYCGLDVIPGLPQALVPHHFSVRVITAW
jgi:hypothetical protein